MRKTLQQYNLPSLRSRPGLPEIESLIELQSTAALLVDIPSLRILTANTRASELTAYSRAELSSLDFKTLFKDFDATGFFEAESGSVDLMMTRKNQTTEKMHVKYSRLGKGNKWALLSLTHTHPTTQPTALQLNPEDLWRGHQELNNAQQEPDLNKALHLALQAGQRLINASILAIYQAEGQSLELKRTAALGLELPEKLPSQDLISLRSPQLWTPGLRPRAKLHYFALSSSLSYLATAPLGQPNALIGLAVTGDLDREPNPNTLTLLQNLAGGASTIIQRLALISSLQNQLTELKRAQLFHKMVESTIQDGVVLVTPDLRVLNLNTAAELALGYTQAEAQGHLVEDIFIGFEGLQSQLEAARKGIPTVNQENIRLYRRSGQSFLSRLSVLPVSQAGKFEGLIILFQDLSEREHIQAQAQQLERQALLGEFTAIFAHEVRNPINNISTGLQLMAYNLEAEDPNQETISRLQQDCDRLEDLMKSVLSLSKPSEYPMETVNVGLLVSRLLDRMRSKIIQAQVKHHLQVDSESMLVEGNPRALEQVFSNLIKNALQAMDGGGNLAIKIQLANSTSERKYIEITIADDGPGIPKENLERIFSLFFTTKTQGTGLGLAITKRIITAHKGTIQVDSVPGCTTFTVTLPAIAPT